MAKGKKITKKEEMSSKFIFWVIGLIAIGIVGLIFLR